MTCSFLVRFRSAAVEEPTRIERAYVDASKRYWAAYDAEPLVPGVPAPSLVVERDTIAAYDATVGFTKLPEAANG